MDRQYWLGALGCLILSVHVPQTRIQVRICPNTATVQQVDVLAGPFWLPFPPICYHATYVRSMAICRASPLCMAT